MTSEIQSPLIRCPRCKSREDARNIVVCIDGTSNQFGQNNTNVVKLFAKIDLESDARQQRAYYSSGIGARPESLNIFARMGRAVSDKFDMAIAWNLEEIVKDAYTWLAQTYGEGDQIYLFGFSRGAYQVRVLAAMIQEVGLIRTPTKKQIDLAYTRYEAIRSGKAKTRQDANEFKNTFSWKYVRVHFVGVWDTVSSVGLIKGDVFLSTSTSAAHACHFRHALALDERRVKFMPEYFHEMNSLTKCEDGMYKYTPGTEGTEVSRDIGTPDVKEVWFAGSHSDVGGTSKSGTPHQAGNVSLLWMRREAKEHGLVLKPTDIVWVPDDVDFGISDSMTWGWKVIEEIPITHQVSFSGPGENGRRRHRQQPRRIIPGQKIHASILYANAYQPRATLGEGFDIPFMQVEDLEKELDGQRWETGLFDSTAAQALVDYLGRGIAPIYLDRLLFMLRFEEGMRYVRGVDGWEEKFKSLMNDHECPSLVRLIAIVAYFEVSAVPLDVKFTDMISKVAKICFDDVLKEGKPQDYPRVVSLLRPLTKHPFLRKDIIDNKVLDTLLRLLDKVVGEGEGIFAQAMNGLDCLLQCEDTRGFFVRALEDPFPGSKVTRLSKILQVKKPRLLTAALHMTLTLARISADACNVVKPRLTKLARSKERLVGLLAVEIYITLYVPSSEGKTAGTSFLNRLKIGCKSILKRLTSCGAEKIDIRDARVRSNLADVLVHLNTDRCGSAERQADTPHPGRQELNRLFGLDASKLGEPQKKLIKQLKNAVRNENARERTAATMTLIKLCGTKAIRMYLHEIGLLNVLIYQLQRKNKALLAAYALAACLEHDDMKEFITDNRNLPEYIVGMLRNGYFDDAIDSVEGFQIFRELMRNADLWEAIKSYFNTKNHHESKSHIVEVLNKKLGKGEPKETRRSLICMDIILSIDEDRGVSWTGELVDKGLQYLHNQKWETQKAGIAILSAMAQTGHGIAAIKPNIPYIIDMLIPKEYRRTRTMTNLASQRPGGGGSTLASGLALRMMKLVNPLFTLMRNGDSTPSQKMGPACALRLLARNETLRNAIREPETTNTKRQYIELKDLYQSGMLVGVTDTPAWRMATPNRSDVTYTLEQMFKIVDKEVVEDDLLSVRDTMLPHIQHRDRLLTMLGYATMEGIVLLPTLVVAMIVGVPVWTVFMSIHLSGRAYWRVRSTIQDVKSHSVWKHLRRREGGRSMAA